MIRISPDEIVARLKKLAKVLENHLTSFTCEISFAQARIVMPIAKDGKGYSMHELAAIAGVDKALVSRVIAELESKGIVERSKASDSNERNYKIVLAKKGQELFDKMKKSFETRHHKWRDKLSEEQLATFINVLVTMTDVEEEKAMTRRKDA